MREMDCLLMYHLEREGCQEVITGKFFDYVSARVPIFCLSPLEMEGAQLIAAHDLGICADYDEFDQVRNAFRALYEGRFVIGEGDVQMFSREAQYSKAMWCQWEAVGRLHLLLQSLLGLGARLVLVQS